MRESIATGASNRTIAKTRTKGPEWEEEEAPEWEGAETEEKDDRGGPSHVLKHATWFFF